MVSPGKHILETFNSSMDGLQSNLLLMASLVERGLRNAMTGLFERDDHLCNNVIASDEEIDLLEKQVDKDGIELLRRFQPVATDLRLVIAAIKLNGNLERVGDQAVNIARRARKLNRAPMLDEVHLLEPMFHEAISMLKESLTAFAQHDVDLALSIKPRDKQLDAMNLDVSDTLTLAMAKSPERIARYINLLFIARCLERVGDHAKNISEEVVFAISAEDIRHMTAVSKNGD